MTMQYDADILIVGLGPVGAVLAGLLRCQNLSIIVVDRETAPYALPRAATFDDEAMRVFQSLGIAEELARICRVPARLEFVSAGGDVLMDFLVHDAPTVSGWRRNYLLHQPHIESLVRRRLEELGVDIRLGARFESATQDSGGVSTHLHGQAGRTTLRTKYLIGCDGASSPVRSAMGCALDNYDFEEPWLVVDVLCEIPDLLPDRVMQICDPRRPSTYLRMTGQRYRWEFMMLEGETEQQMTEPSFIKSLLAPWVDATQITIERSVVYRFHALVAQRWRNERILIAGDAAHQMPPFAGQGMCAGIRDARNLAWKLAAVISGTAPPALLDTYQAEREPHIRHIIETVIAMGNIICLRDSAAAAARDAGMLAQRAAGAQPVSMDWPDLHGGCFTTTPGAGSIFPQTFAGGVGMDDVFGPGWWLIGDTPQQHDGINIIPLGSDQAFDFSAGLRAWLSKHEAQAVLVRPDRFVFGTGSPAWLLEQWRARHSDNIGEKNEACL
jgi:3-(3-hydroxy-phenyl)propionate hydroxylase